MTMKDNIFYIYVVVKHRNKRFGESNVPVWNSRKSHAELEISCGFVQYQYLYFLP